MQEQRTFKIINLTGLENEESEDIVSILNQVMNQRNMESGRKVVEFIIRDYKAKIDSFAIERETFIKDFTELKREKFLLREELKRHEAVTESLKELFENFKKL